MSSRDSTRLLFSGKKCFWKSNISIDVLLIHHSPAQTIEVVAYNADIQREAPRLYVNEAVLLLALDNCSVVSGSESCTHIFDTAKVDYIFDRIAVASESENFEIDLQDSVYSSSDGEMLLIVAKPMALVAYTSPFVQHSR